MQAKAKQEKRTVTKEQKKEDNYLRLALFDLTECGGSVNCARADRVTSNM